VIAALAAAAAAMAVSVLLPSVSGWGALAVFLVVAFFVFEHTRRGGARTPLPPSVVVSLQSLLGAAVLTALFWYFITDAARWWVYGIVFLCLFGGLNTRLLALGAHRRTIDGE
jgi:hypothetical protein